MEGFKEHINALVIGDVRLDMDMHVDFTRISSREKANMPVGLSTGRGNLVWGAGAAGNLAANMSRMGACVYLAGTWGNGCDPYRHALETILRHNNVYTDGMATVRQTYCYGRYEIAGQLHARYDVNVDPLNDAEKSELVEGAKSLLSIHDFDVVVLCDYVEEGEAGGVCFPEMIELATSRNITFGSSRDNPERMSVDYLVINEEEWKRQPAEGRRVTVKTRGEEGVVAVYGDAELKVNTVPVPAPNNPCGAGDTFFAAYILATASCFPLEKACRIGVAAARYTAKQLVGTGYPEWGDIYREYEEIYGEVIG